MELYTYINLVTETEKKNETAVGNVKDGMVVDCRPALDDPQIIQRQSRVVCLVKPYTACYYCSHSSFDLLFNTNRDRRFEQVSCPKWERVEDRLKSNPPIGYVSVESATCAEMPFEFCPSCPTKKNVEITGADKSTPGWYGRWSRIHTEEVGEYG